MVCETVACSDRGFLFVHVETRDTSSHDPDANLSDSPRVGRCERGDLAGKRGRNSARPLRPRRSRGTLTHGFGGVGRLEPRLSLSTCTGGLFEKAPRAKWKGGHASRRARAPTPAAPARDWPIKSFVSRCFHGAQLAESGRYSRPNGGAGLASPFDGSPRSPDTPMTGALRAVRRTIPRADSRISCSGRRVCTIGSHFPLLLPYNAYYITLFTL